MKILKTLPVVFLCACLMLISTAGAEEEQQKVKQHKIVRLHFLGGISPDTVTIEPGTTVVWINDARSAVELQFEGKQVTLACKSPVHFIIDEAGSYLSDRIPQGSVASLCFVEKGEFSYVLRKAEFDRGKQSLDVTRTTIKEFRGKVIVK